MAKKKGMASGGYEIGRLVDQSGGMVDSVVHPTLLQDHEAALLKNVSLDEKGTVKPCLGRIERYEQPFDPDNPCNGIYSFYPDTTTSRLIIGAGSKLYKDTPHLITRWTEQAHFEEAGSVRINCDTATKPGELTVTTPPTATFARASVAYLPDGTEATVDNPRYVDGKYTSDGTQVAANVPRFEQGKFGKAVIVEEGTTNLWSKGNPETWEGYSISFFGDPFHYSSAQIVEFQGRTCLKVHIVSAGDGTQGWRGCWISHQFTTVTGDTYTQQCEMYVEPGGRRQGITSKPQLNGEGTLFGSGAHINYDLNQAGTWQKLIRKSTANADGKGNLNIYLFSANAGTVYDADYTVYLYHPQIEKLPYATSFIDGTRAAETLTIPTAGVLNENEFDITGWFIPATSSSVVPAWARIWVLKGVPLTGLFINDSVICFAWNDNQIINTNISLSANDQLFYSVSKSGSNVVIRLAKNGGALSTFTGTTDGTTLGATEISLGSSGMGGLFYNGKHDDLRISNRALTDEEIAAAYQSGQPLPVDEYTTAKMNFDSNLAISIPFIWISDKKDVTAAQDTASGKVETKIDTPGGSSITVLTRTSDNGTTWDDWQIVASDNTIQSAYKNYIQVKVIGKMWGADKPSVQEIVLSYDGSPSATELASGFTPGGQWFFDTLLSKCIMTNKLDAPMVWDGYNPIAVLGGSPPHAQYVAAHRNYLFMAGTSEGPSRLYFSEVLNLESWPVLNFIDISPNDGDWITGLLPYDDYLVITKNRSVWLLVGSGPSDFEMRRIHDGIGCVAPRSLVRVVDSFAFVSTEGIYLSDISTPTLISERLKETWKKLNRRRLHQIAAEYYDHKLRVDVPYGSSIHNNMRIIYDTIRKCLYLQELSAHASCYTKFSEAGQDVLLFGHAHNGQVSQADTGTSDAGLPIKMEWGTKYFNFGSSAVIKKVRNLYFVVVPTTSPVTVQVYLIVDGEELPTPLEFEVVPGKMVYKLKPRNIGVRSIRSLGYRIVQAEASGGVRFHELLQEYLPKKVKPS